MQNVIDSLIDSRTFQAGPNIVSGGGGDGFIGSNNATESWDGVIDEFAIYDAPLTSDEIAAHYANVLIGQNYFFSSIPEPSTGMLSAMGATLLLRRKRRRRD